MLFFLLLISLAFAEDFEDVQTTCGTIRGLKFNSQSAFMGIPFAAPPEKKLRWKPPLPITESNVCPWTETRMAVKPGNMCVQPNATSSSFTRKIRPQSEDCLYLHVFTPNTNASLPVTVWFHGGGLSTGDAFEAFPGQVGNPQIVNVSVNYRMSTFGYMALKELSESNGNQVSGNYGHMDAIEALRWVQENIQNFGGDPNRVTIAGGSSGGTIVYGLMQSPLAQGLFHGAFAGAGSAYMGTDLATAEKFNANTWLQQTKCVNFANETLIDCLYGLTAKEVAYQPTSFAGPDSDIPVLANDEVIAALEIADGFVIPSDRWSSFNGSAGFIIDVPFVIGDAREEFDFMPPPLAFDKYTETEWQEYLKTKFANDMIPKINELYPSDLPVDQRYFQISSDIRMICPNIRLAHEASKGLSSSIYVYILIDHLEKPLCPTGMHFCMKYAFHCLDMMLYLNAKSLHPLTERDNKLMRLIQTIYNNFFINGDIPVWQTFQNGDGYFINLIYADKVAPVLNYKRKQCEFWHDKGYDKFASID